MDFLQSNLFLFVHISDVLNEQATDIMSNRDECIANQHVCVVYSLQKNPSTMADKINTDHLATTFVNFFREKYMLAMYKYVMVIPTHLHCVQGKHLIRN